MNKKRLSVVMAGAMLASSVAPVMAYTVDKDSVEKYEVNGSNKGILIRDLRNLLTSKVFANETINAGDASTRKPDVRNQSVYDIKVNGNEFYKVEENDAHGVKALEEAIKTAAVGSKIEVFDRGHMVNNGKYYHYAVKDVEGVDATFDATELQTAFNNWKSNPSAYPAVYEMLYNKTEKVLTVKTRAAESETAHLTLTFKEGSKQVNFADAIDSNGDSTDNLATVVGFRVLKDNSYAKNTEIDGKQLAEIIISDIDVRHEVKLSDLYDGLLLTEKGQKLLDAMKEYVADENDSKVLGYPAKQNVSDIDDSANGIYSMKVLFKNDGVQEEVVIKTNDRAKLELLQLYLREKNARVEVLAGDNRYETAVKVAKENAKMEDVAVNGNIVLVNGNALVDGLAAAPLAASVWNKKYDETDVKSDTKVAPILLTEANTLPKATKEYMKELVKYQQVGKLDRVTVYLVGGETVISKGLEKELRDLGLRVVRAGGANREETSLEVAEVMLKDGDLSKVDMSNAFVVGADGEADAMSIAPVAAAKGNPIIVESKKGLSEEAIEKLNGWKNTNVNTTDVTVVGGETVVSNATVEALKAEKIDVTRVGGSNRQATNAAVISKYAAAGLEKVVISKDGSNNRKTDLIDALTATSLAVKDNAPIVLGTNKLSTVQINALEQKASRKGVYVYQVGHGVARDVLKTIATRVGLAK